MVTCDSGFVTMSVQNSGAGHEDELKRVNEDEWTKKCSRRNGAEGKDRYTDEAGGQELIQSLNCMFLGVGMMEGWIDEG